MCWWGSSLVLILEFTGPSGWQTYFERKSQLYGSGYIPAVWIINDRTQICLNALQWRHSRVQSILGSLPAVCGRTWHYCAHRREGGKEIRSGVSSGSASHHKNSCQLNFPLKFALLLLRTFSKSHYGLINCKNELSSGLRYPSLCLLRKLNSIIFSVRTALASRRGYKLNKDEDFSPRMEMIQKNQRHQLVHWSSALMGWIWVIKTEWNIVLIQDID